MSKNGAFTDQPIMTCIAEKLCLRFQRSNTQVGLLGSLLVRTSLILFAANEESKWLWFKTYPANKN
jgi:hypothetical protein